MGCPITEIIDPVFPPLKGARLPQFPQCDYSRIVWIFPPVGGVGLALAQHILWRCPRPHPFPALGLRRVWCPVHLLVPSQAHTEEKSNIASGAAIFQEDFFFFK